MMPLADIWIAQMIKGKVLETSIASERFVLLASNAGFHCQRDATRALTLPNTII